MIARFGNVAAHYSERDNASDSSSIFAAVGRVRTQEGKRKDYVSYVDFSNRYISW